MAFPNGYSVRVGAALLAALVATTAGPVSSGAAETNTERRIRLRKGEETPRRYNRSMEVHDTMMHMGRPTKKQKPSYAEDLDIPEAREPMFTIELEQPTPYGYEAIPEQPVEREEKKKNWILPPKPDDLEEDEYSSEPNDLIRRALEEEDAARRAFVDSFYGDRSSRSEPGTDDDEEEDATYDRSGNRIRQASDNLLYTEADEYDLLLGSDEDVESGEPDGYNPVISDRVLTSGENEETRSGSSRTITDEQLETLSLEQLEELAREQEEEEEEEETLSIADGDVLPLVTRFTQGAGDEQGGLWQTRQMLAELNTIGPAGTDEGAGGGSQAGAGRLSEDEWSGTFTGLSAALDSGNRVRQTEAMDRTSYGVGDGLRRIDSGTPGVDTRSHPSMDRIRGQFEFGRVQPTSDFAIPGASGGSSELGGLGRSIAGTPDRASSIGSVPSATLGSSIQGTPATPKPRKGIDVRTLDILMN